MIRSDNPALLSLPWECLYHPSLGFLGKHDGFTFSRQLTTSAGPAAPLPNGPLKVLLFTCLPDDLVAGKERLDTEAEQEKVLEALDPWIKEGWVELTCPDDGRFTIFRQLLKKETFHLVFLSGHGKFLDNTLMDKPAQAFFLFEGESGFSDPVEAQEIAKVFLGTFVQCVALSACQTGKLASDDLHVGLAAGLFQVHIPHVVGMQESIYDRAGEGITLNNIFQIYDARGDFDKALEYLKQALSIYREIGDRTGLCSTLFNMGHIHMTRKETQEAMSAWVTAYLIAKEIGHAEVLVALKNLAKGSGEEGLAFWERLAQAMPG